ncbi:NAD(P)-binding protein [Saitoella complicata NRRL Y-17804]|uniref:NAD(P)-binding protein n=1 Tax=Saitoella complicata (strain BCRC 22490 / CBS 7301 / JCM 7358 / NBRC 10748 / NRRL Y-17804) TaxID=698492 RepID=UPI00086758BE|nr:NAD(P)-binding protein [Saitoella complicata NRRL Y-17804]ODQ49940.1 NAD(P)-binding protein [Saitoella complicata NRRL Y-17804]
MGIFARKTSWTPEQIPDQTGKVVVVTGGNAGIGYVTCKHIARRGARIYIASRSLDRTLPAIASLKEETGNENIHHLPLDLTSLSSIRSAATTFLGSESRLDILINNAGIMLTPYGLTKDGYELQFGTNHVGHYAFTHLLLPTLLRTAALPDSIPGSVRVVSIASEGHRGAPSCGIDFGDVNLEKSNPATRYGQSKLANILHARALHNHYHASPGSPIFVSVHPGVIYTDLYKELSGPGVVSTLLSPFMWLAKKSPLFISLEEGAWTQLYAATAPGVESGSYLEALCSVGTPTRQGRDEGLAEKLWEWSLAELERHGIKADAEAKPTPGLAEEE